MESDTGQWMNPCCSIAVLLWATDCPLCGLGLILQPLRVTVGSARGLQVTCTGDPEGATWWPPHAPRRLMGWDSPPIPTPPPPAPPSIRSRGRGRGPGEGGSPAAFSISPRQGLLFFLSCLLGSSSSLFFLQKGRKTNLEHTQLTCHRRWLAQRLALAPWQLKGAGWASPSSQPQEEGKGGRRRDAYLLGAWEGGAILLPLLLLPRGLLASAPQPPALASTTLHPPLPLTECSRKPPTLRRGKSALERSMLQPGGRQRQERGESAFHPGPKTIGRLFERSWVFFHRTWEVSLQKFHWFQCLGVGWTDAFWGGCVWRCWLSSRPNRSPTG